MQRPGGEFAVKQKKWLLIPIVIAIVIALAFAVGLRENSAVTIGVSSANIPPFSENAFVVLDNNQPGFTPEELQAEAFEYYSELDALGRCGYAMACINRELMPTEERENIAHICPSGWKQVQYDVVEGQNLYNRCHLIGFQLAGENDNPKNLITGTRYMNVTGMLPFEDMVADYVKETENHVLYRVTPIYEGDNLLASGVLMEAQSVEDDEILFCVYVYNAQPGITINYQNGESSLSK
jgi:DNA-entry nuclease